VLRAVDFILGRIELDLPNFWYNKKYFSYLQKNQVALIRGPRSRALLKGRPGRVFRRGRNPTLPPSATPPHRPTPAPTRPFQTLRDDGPKGVLALLPVEISKAGLYECGST
jgi:hypothetical protein